MYTMNEICILMNLLKLKLNCTNKENNYTKPILIKAVHEKIVQRTKAY